MEEGLNIQDFGYYNQSFGGGETDNGLYWFTIEGLSHQLKWCSYFGGIGDEDLASIGADDANDLIYVAGGSLIPLLQASQEYCDVPSNGDFPLCSAGGLPLYMETDIDGNNKRAYIASFTSDLTPKWITQFGDGNGNSTTGLSVSQDKLYLVGFSNENWTEWQFDADSQFDYYLERDEDDPFAFDACIARFGTTQLVGINDPKFMFMDTPLMVYPNPTSTNFNIQIGELETAQMLQIYNAMGEVVSSRLVNSNALIQFEVLNMSSGLYLITLSGTQNKSIKLILN